MDRHALLLSCSTYMHCEASVEFRTFSLSENSLSRPLLRDKKSNPKALLNLRDSAGPR
jgi:hypothetical protein